MVTTWAVILDPNFEYVEYADEGLFRVEKGDMIGYVNNKGKWIRDLNH